MNLDKKLKTQQQIALIASLTILGVGAVYWLYQIGAVAVVLWGVYGS